MAKIDMDEMNRVAAEKAAPEEDTPSRATNRQIILGEKLYNINRLGTRDGLNVARSILAKINRLRDPITEMVKLAGTDDTEKQMPGVMALIEGLVEVLDEDELIALASKLLGIDGAVIADAPLEDSLNAIADAFELNKMSSLLNAARRIWESASRFVNNR